MDLSRIAPELGDLSLFDLYRLSTLIRSELDDPERIERVRARLRPGTEIRYYNQRHNRMVDAVVVRLGRTRLVVEDRVGGERWSIRFCLVDLDGVAGDGPLIPGGAEPARDSLSVGELVGFRDRQNREHLGRIEQLNPKTATVRVKGGERWRVAYHMLFRGIEPGPRRLGGGSTTPDTGTE